MKIKKKYGFFDILHLDLKGAIVFYVTVIIAIIMSFLAETYFQDAKWFAAHWMAIFFTLIALIQVYSVFKERRLYNRNMFSWEAKNYTSWYKHPNWL